MGPASNVLETVAAQVAASLSNSPSVKTELGEFRRFQTEAVSGRNPRTGEAIRVPAQTFKYFLVSPRLFKMVFPTSTPEEHLHCVQQEIGRMQARGFEQGGSPPVSEISFSDAVMEQVLSNLKSAGQLSLPQIGVIKIFSGPPPLIFFKPTE